MRHARDVEGVLRRSRNLIGSHACRLRRTDEPEAGLVGHWRGEPRKWANVDWIGGGGGGATGANGSCGLTGTEGSRAGP